MFDNSAEALVYLAGAILSSDPNISGSDAVDKAKGALDRIKTIIETETPESSVQ